IPRTPNAQLRTLNEFTVGAAFLPRCPPTAGLPARIVTIMSLLQTGHAQRSTSNAQRIYCRSGISAAMPANGGPTGPDRDKNVTPTNPAQPLRFYPAHSLQPAAEKIR